nr:imidazole glycerol phosphate synthase subunit HisH [Candidatus Freyarchaeota archaeon]
MLVAIVDYGVGNLRSLEKAFQRVGADCVITNMEKELAESDAIALPGVGAFRDAMKNLEPLSQFIIDFVKEGKPLLGVCLGMQLLFSESTEDGLHRGLNIVKGRVVRLPPSVKIPHIGWNTLTFDKENPLFEGVSDNPYVYFVHSYYPVPENQSVTVAWTEYGVRFSSVIHDKSVYATQFHPEKSGSVGLKILENFVKYCRV